MSCISQVNRTYCAKTGIPIAQYAHNFFEFQPGNAIKLTLLRQCHTWQTITTYNNWLVIGTQDRAKNGQA